MEKKNEPFHPLLDYDAPSALRRYLDEHGLGMQKKFGQNFLINGDVRKRLVQALELPIGAVVWEVGPGLGSMTVELIRQGALVKAFEIDRGFVRALYELIPVPSVFTLIEGDVLKTWPREAAKEQAEGKLCNYFLGNLPYNIAATLLADFIEKGRFFKRLVVTIQKEVAQRMLAKSGSKDYSSFTVLCSSAYTIKPLMVLKGPSFYPVPNVDSQAVLMDLRTDRNPMTDTPLFRSMVRSIFSNRRKNLKNNLISFLSSRYSSLGKDLSSLVETAITQAGLRSQQRAEELDLDAFIRLASKVESLICL
ncbi:16S rRNA (adenine(1518)-N(6)/adenine(1519)-N(6))-dimethyltransferase RsmA [Gracilinema caldarium]|uniref:16S rRNA (adenine(1518)-N(6)/adenine(1519)-N(6))- dimethyltransferase RsmA n=1 Tax=Gracilinema caldarium TaxID=215591 RepID=UPI00059D57B6|nr:16S rRNA (adenine(1518)-N(6)/adenine(1519)-N(6))-dimethyltransferase RsmA [Gracilinema caldarium]